MRCFGYKKVGVERVVTHGIHHCAFSLSFQLIALPFLLHWLSTVYGQDVEISPTHHAHRLMPVQPGSLGSQSGAFTFLV